MSAPKTKRRPDLHPNAGRQLILGNGATLRQQARRDYDQARRKLDQARQELDRFKTEDRPAFEVWLHHTFGPELTQLRELAKEQQDAAHLVIEVEQLAFLKGLSPAEAYRLARHRRAHPEATPPPPQADPKTEADFKKFAQDYADRRSQNLAPGSESSGGATETGATARVKELYRLLARKLHPDSQAQMTPQKLE